MTTRYDPARVWMAGALGGGIALAAMLLAFNGTGVDGVALAVHMTARWSFLFFWLCYAGGALAVLFGPAFAGLARRARSLGLAFAAALLVHLGLVGWLSVAIGRIPLQGGVLWVFVIAVLCTCLLVSLSFGIGTRSLGRFWRPLLWLSTTYILIAFGRDFVGGALHVNARNWLDAAEYLPFALLSVLAIPLRLAARLRQRFDPRSAAPVAELDREPVPWR